MGFDPGIARREGWYCNILCLAFANDKILMSDVQDKLQHSVHILHVNKMYAITILLKKTKITAFKAKFLLLLQQLLIMLHRWSNTENVIACILFKLSSKWHNIHTQKDLNTKLNQYNRHMVCRRTLMAKKWREQLKLNTVKTRWTLVHETKTWKIKSTMHKQNAIRTDEILQNI